MKPKVTPRLGGVVVELEQEDRILLALAMATLAIERPGWKTRLGEVAQKLETRESFDRFVTIYALNPTHDRKPPHASNR